MIGLRVHFLLFLPLLVASTILRRWPLAKTLPVDDLHIDGTSAGPNGTALCVGLNGSNTCHDADASCNQCRSNEPHIFHITWCADTAGYRGISCDLDLGYRSAQGARNGFMEYSLKGLGSKAADFSNSSGIVIFPDSPYEFSHFAAASGKNDILTVFQMAMVEGNTDGDNLKLTESSGFCCRATFSGGKTVTGTLYIGDLTIRANGVVTATVTPSAAATPTPPLATETASGYSGAALGGGIVGGALAGGAAVLSAQILISWMNAARGGMGSAMSATSAETRGLLAASRLSSMKAVGT